MEEHNYLNNLICRVFSNFISVFLTLLSILVADGMNAFKDKYLTVKILILLAIMVGVLIVMAIGYIIYDFISWLCERLKIKDKGLIFPHNIRPSDILPFIFKDIKIKYKYVYNKDTKYFDLEERCEYILTAASLDSNVRYINHIFKASDNDINIGNVKVSTESISKDNRIVKAGFIKNEELHSDKLVNQIYRVEFERKLIQGSEIKYVLILLRKNYILPYETHECSSDFQEKIAVIETAKFSLSVEFPRKYKLIQPQIVILGKSDIELKKVEDIYRKLNKGFETDISSDPPKASLEVDSPIPNIRYQIAWRLPSKEYLTEMGFFND